RRASDRALGSPHPPGSPAENKGLHLSRCLQLAEPGPSHRVRDGRKGTRNGKRLATAPVVQAWIRTAASGGRLKVAGGSVPVPVSRRREVDLRGRSLPRRNLVVRSALHMGMHPPESKNPSQRKPTTRITGISWPGIP